MNDLEARVARRLEAAAQRVIVHPDHEMIIEHRHRPTRPPARRRPRWPLAAAAAVVLIGAGATLAGRAGGPTTVPTSVPGDAPHFVGPVVDQPPEWAGDFVINQSGGASNLPAAVAVLGRGDSPPGRVDRPIVVTVGEPMTCGDYEDDGSTEYAMPSGPDACVFFSDPAGSRLEWDVNSGIHVAGAVDVDVLAQVARSVTAERLGYADAFLITELPTGYEVVAGPTLVDLRASPGTGSAVAQITNLSNYRDPILALLRVGVPSSIERVDVNGAAGWRTEWELAWEPQPGVILLASAWSTGQGPPDVTQDQLFELAESVTLVPEAEWYEMFDPS